MLILLLRYLRGNQLTWSIFFNLFRALQGLTPLITLSTLWRPRESLELNTTFQEHHSTRSGNQIGFYLRLSDSDLGVPTISSHPASIDIKMLFTTRQETPVARNQSPFIHWCLVAKHPVQQLFNKSYVAD